MAKLNWSLGPVATAGFGLVLIVLVFNSIIVHQKTVDLHASQKDTNHTYDVLIRAQAVLASLRDAEASAEKHVITGDDSFLKAYQQKSALVLDAMNRLRESVGKDSRQAAQLIALDQGLKEKSRFLDEMTAARSTKGMEAARQLLLDGGGQSDLKSIRTIIDDMTTVENQELSTRTHAQEYGVYLVLAANLLAVISSTTITFVAWYLIDQELRMRRSAEAAARMERQNLLVTLTSIDDGVIVTDDAGKVKLINPSAQHLIGNPRLVIGRPLAKIFSIVNEVTREPVENPVNQVLAQGKISRYAGHTALLRSDGTEVPIEQSAAPIHDASGRITGVVFVFRDCSVRRQFEKEMRERERRFQRVFETPLIGVAVCTSRGVLLEANSAFLDLIGYRRGQFNKAALSWSDVPNDQSPLDEAAQRELRDKGVCKPFERYYAREDGSRIPVLISAARLTDDQDRIVVFVTNLSQSKRAEAALLESEARFRALSDCMPQKVWTARPNGNIDYLNQRLLNYTGMTFDRMKEQGWSDLIHPEDVQLQRDAWRQSLSTGKMFEIELRFRNEVGDYRWHLARAAPVTGPDGRITMWVGTYTDIHYQKQAEEVLRDEHHRKDEFLALLAHELRNPLAPLSNAIHAFPAVLNDPQSTDELLNIMRRQVRQMTRLIDDLLDLARITTGRMRLRRERLLVKTAIAAAIESVEPFIAERRHQLTVTVPEEDLWLDADAARLTQILTNLLHNAAKFTDSHGRIELTVERDGQDVLLRISDNGPGIPQDMLTKVFDLFMQLELTLDRAHGGLGIGLTLVRTLVELHGGTVTCASAGAGQGSEFVVRLPLTQSPELEKQTDKPGDHSQTTQTASVGLQILVVDDVQASAKTLALLLKSLGQNVEVAFDGKSAIARASETNFDLIFLDIAMPGMDGLEVARRLRASPQLRSVRLIALTGFGQDADRTNSLDAGFDEHFTKPVSLDLLKDIIQRASTIRNQNESQVYQSNFNGGGTVDAPNSQRTDSRATASS